MRRVPEACCANNNAEEESLAVQTMRQFFQFKESVMNTGSGEKHIRFLNVLIPKSVMNTGSGEKHIMFLNVPKSFMNKGSGEKHIYQNRL